MSSSGSSKRKSKDDYYSSKRSRSKYYKPSSSVYSKSKVSATKDFKYVDTAITVSGCDTTGALTLLNGLSQGSDISNRIGRKYMNKSIELRGYFTTQVAAGATAPQAIRVALICDNQPTGVAPTLVQIFDTISGTTFKRLDFRNRFTIIKDKLWTPCGVYETASSTDSSSSPTVHWYKKINLKTVNMGTGATISAINSGALYLVTLGTSAAGAGYDFNFQARVKIDDEA